MNHNSKRITKADKGFAWKLDFKDIKVPVKTREIHNVEKKNFISFSVSGYESNKEHPIYVSKKYNEEKKHGDLLLIGKEGKKHYVLINHFNTFTEENTFAIIVYKLLVQKKY